MIPDHLQEQASFYVLGSLTADEQAIFEAELRHDLDLRRLVMEFEKTAAALAMNIPNVNLPAGLKDKVLQRIGREEAKKAAAASPAKSFPESIEGLRFLTSDDSHDWKQLPIPGAWIKLLSLERDRGYALLMGKLEPGARYPAHQNAGPEDFYILTGDLNIGSRKLNAGDFHHADSGSMHEENYSIGGCTLLAVLTTDDPLVAFALE